MADNRMEFTVRGIDSEADEREVSDALEGVLGVQMASVDRESGRVEVRYGEELLSEEDVRSAARDAGYEVE